MLRVSTFSSDPSLIAFGARYCDHSWNIKSDIDFQKFCLQVLFECSLNKRIEELLAYSSLLNLAYVITLVLRNGLVMVVDVVGWLKSRLTMYLSSGVLLKYRDHKLHEPHIFWSGYSKAMHNYKTSHSGRLVDVIEDIDEWFEVFDGDMARRRWLFEYLMQKIEFDDEEASAKPFGVALVEHAKVCKDANIVQLGVKLAIKKKIPFFIEVLKHLANKFKVELEDRRGTNEWYIKQVITISCLLYS
ncbi:anaphase-promoting complex subunit 1 [Tanacetum coccineum]